MNAVLAAREPQARYLHAQKPQLLGHMDLLASAPDGVARLRKLILRLAVQGKLTSRQSGDEPLEGLLAQLRKESGLSDGERAVADANTLPCALPESWDWIRLTDLGEFRGGKTPSTQRRDYWDGTIPWITPKDMKQLRLCDSQDHVSSAAVEDGLSLIPPHSVLIVVRSGILKRTVPIAINDVETTINQDLKALVPALPGLAPYVQLMVRGFEDYILQNLTKVGTTVESIQFQAFASQLFPLPPLAEQARIVARVDELMRVCDALETNDGIEAEQHARLLDVLLGSLSSSTSPEELATKWQRVAAHFDLLLNRPAAVDALEDVILTLATQGMLVDRPGADDSAAPKFTQAYAGQADRHRMESTRPDENAGKVQRVPGTLLAREWKSVQLGDLVRVLNGRAYSKQELLESGRTPVLRVGNLFTSKHWYYSNLALDPDKYCEDGDLLYAWSASFGPVIWRGPKTIYHYHIWKLEPIDPRQIDKDFLYNVLLEKTSGIKAAGHGVSMVHMTKAKMERLLVPCPPLAVQRQVVSRIKSFREASADLRNSLIAARDLQARLAEALVVQAAQPQA